MVLTNRVVAQFHHAIVVNHVALVVNHEVFGQTGIAKFLIIVVFDFLVGASRLPDTEFINLSIQALALGVGKYQVAKATYTAEQVRGE